LADLLFPFPALDTAAEDFFLFLDIPPPPEPPAFEVPLGVEVPLVLVPLVPPSVGPLFVDDVGVGAWDGVVWADEGPGESY